MASALAALVIRMSSCFDRSISANCSSLLKVDLTFLGVTLCYARYLSRLVPRMCVLHDGYLAVHFLFLFCLKNLLPSLILLFVVSLKYALSLIHLKKSFKSASSSFLLYMFGAGIKFKFLMKSLYLVLVDECLVKLIIFPFGSD